MLTLQCMQMRNLFLQFVLGQVLKSTKMTGLERSQTFLSSRGPEYNTAPERFARLCALVNVKTCDGEQGGIRCTFLVRGSGSFPDLRRSSK